MAKPRRKVSERVGDAFERQTGTRKPRRREVERAADELDEREKRFGTAGLDAETRGDRDAMREWLAESEIDEIADELDAGGQAKKQAAKSTSKPSSAAGAKRRSSRGGGASKRRSSGRRSATGRALSDAAREPDRAAARVVRRTTSIGWTVFGITVGLILVYQLIGPNASSQRLAQLGSEIGKGVRFFVYPPRAFPEKVGAERDAALLQRDRAARAARPGQLPPGPWRRPNRDGTVERMRPDGSIDRLPGGTQSRIEPDGTQTEIARP